MSARRSAAKSIVMNAIGQERTPVWTGSVELWNTSALIIAKLGFFAFPQPDHSRDVAALLPYARSEETSSESNRESNQSIML